MGALLVQRHEDGVEHVVQYVSHQLSDTQKRWSTIEKEAYAVIYAITKLRPYLLGSKFTVYTDHKPLTSLFAKPILNTKIQRWALLLSEYGAEIKYYQGKYNVRADMLSRIPTDYMYVSVIDVDHEWIDPLAFPDEIEFQQLPCLIDGLDLESIHTDQKQEFPDLFQSAKFDDESNYIVLNNILYSTRRPSPESPSYPRLVLPKRYRENVILRAHKEVGHMACFKTLHRICDAYIWPGMRKDVRSLLAKCPTCIAHSRKRDHTEMGTMPTPVSPMQMVSMDLIGPFVTSTLGNRYILTIICHCSGWAEAYPIPNKSNDSVWRMFANHFVPSHGTPEVILTDNAREFTAKIFTNALEKLGIEHRRCTPTHPNSNGKIERFNRTCKETLSRLIQNQPDQWENHVGDTLAAHRISVSSVTGYSSFYLLYGRQPCAPLSRLLQASTQ